ncbi:MAG: type III-B CRISPR-associated protein Cas10/Cmr2 [Cyanobacteriota bacterium]|nr:type III-B CRISPR-associated protein Cas10/Cmr2 [Cyanobacteriota bacterium]
MTFTAVTFAPVQSFIRSSRKLRDLYGSSLLLSHLGHALYADASKRLGPQAVVSPANVSLSRGVPNALVISGDYRASQARAALLAAWGKVLEECRTWLENNITHSNTTPISEGWSGDWDAEWGASWKAAALHSWEVFHGQGNTIAEARKALKASKWQRDWSLPNWTGESSTLSSAEAVVRPTMARVVKPWLVDPDAATKEAREFLTQLRAKLGEAFAGENEEISLLELVKRLITYRPILKRAFQLPGKEALPEQTVDDLLQKNFPRLTTRAHPDKEKEAPESIIWFMADGDGVGSHIQALAESGKDEEAALRAFSQTIRDWAASLYERVPQSMGSCRKATVVYAGGDDVFGALHETEPGNHDLTAADLWHWLETFPDLWQDANQPQLSISMGLVWADAKVPQREALQHARLAEGCAKARGKDRFALRLLHASGNHLEWSCPWTWLRPIRASYRDREHRQGAAASWRHLGDDLVWLQERQAITAGTAEALWEAYFPDCVLPAHASGTPGDRHRPTRAEPEAHRPFSLWLLDLGRVMAGLEKHRDKEEQERVRAGRPEEVAR